MKHYLLKLIPQDPSLFSFYQEVTVQLGYSWVACAQKPLVQVRLLSKLESEASLAQLVMEKTRNTCDEDNKSER